MSTREVEAKCLESLGNEVGAVGLSKRDAGRLCGWVTGSFETLTSRFAPRNARAEAVLEFEQVLESGCRLMLHLAAARCCDMPPDVALGVFRLEHRCTFWNTCAFALSTWIHWVLLLTCHQVYVLEHWCSDWNSLPRRRGAKSGFQGWHTGCIGTRA